MCLKCMWKRVSDPMRLIPIVRRYLRSESYLVHLLTIEVVTIAFVPWVPSHTCWAI
jgi:hypothetical protein